MRAFVLALLAVPAAAFTSLPSAAPRAAARTAPMMAEMSPSVPFCLAPKYYPSKLVGDVGFDPLGLTQWWDINLMREAELKHGRVAMLAILGILVQEFYQLPGEAYSNPNPVLAVAQVGPQPMAQIIFGMGFVEFGLHQGKVTVQEMIPEYKTRAPGDFGFDPLGLMEEGDPNEYALKEITHCRLAMIAVGGMIHQSFVTGAGVFGHTT